MSAASTYALITTLLFAGCHAVTKKSVSLIKVRAYDVDKFSGFAINHAGDRMFICGNGFIRICRTVPPFDETRVTVEPSPVSLEFTQDGRHFLTQDDNGFTIVTADDYDFVKRIQVDSVLLRQAHKIIAVSDTAIFLTYTEFEPVRLTRRYDRPYNNRVHVYDILRRTERQVAGDIVSYDVDDSCKTLTAVLHSNDVVVWNLVDLKKVLVIPGGLSLVTKAFISDHGTILAVVEANNELALWDLVSKTKIGSFELGENSRFFYSPFNSNITLSQFGVFVDSGMCDALSFDSMAGLGIRSASGQKLFAVYVKTRDRIDLWTIDRGLD